MNRMLDLLVPAPSEGERLDRFLAAAQLELSRSRLQGLIREGRVRVNGRVARASARLRPGDRVQVELPDPARAEDSRLEPEDRPLPIVFEDEWLIVIDKPAGLVVHPGAGVGSGTLVHALLHHHPGIAAVGGASRPGIVHRLDRDTSGLMVVAKEPRSHRALVEAMRAREVRRIYRALVWGVPARASGTIEAPIGRDPRRRQRMAVVARGGKPATTHWKVIDRFRVAAELELMLESGRTHQIRVHLSHLGHPVIGDPVYGGRGKKQLRPDAPERSLVRALHECLTRQALHARELEFPHPITGERLRFNAVVPDDLSRAVGLLRAHRDHRRA
jgi:23S rRNA pseudouridine1911/1915/1917 synthase